MGGVSEIECVGANVGELDTVVTMFVVAFKETIHMIMENVRRTKIATLGTPPGRAEDVAIRAACIG